MIRSSVVFFVLLLTPILLWAQEEAMRVERASAINPDAPVYNIFIDEQGEKWVSNSEGLWQVHAANLASKVMVGAAEETLLSFPNGNKDIRWPSGVIDQELGGILTASNQITSAFYNEIQDHLWVGTSESGIFLFRTQPTLKWIKEINKRMPKLRSNTINMIYVDGDDDRHFMGTDEGVIVGRDGRWGLEERYFRFQAVANRGKEVWLLAEDLIWVVNADEEWRSVEIDPEQIRGPIKDIAFDREGKLWIASEYLTMFDVDSNTYKVFDGGDYFTSNDVNCLAVDLEGAVWVGTQDKGLYVIEKESAMTVTCLLESELSCDPNINNASLSVKIKGGQPPYTYLWDQGLAGENPQNLGVGTFKVTVTDSRGQSKVAEGVVPDTRLKLAVVQNRPHTDEKRGAATATVEGGKPKFTYLWDNGENGPQAERLEAGLHRVTVTDINGCKAESALEITRDMAALAASVARVGDDPCAQDKGHSVQLKIQGGIEPYAVTWSDPSLSGVSPTSVKPGTYAATITDAAKNQVQVSINLAEIQIITATASQIKAADLEGKKGAASVKVSGGTGRMKYLWDNGETGQNAESLSAGSHSVTVTDQNGCLSEATVEITRELASLAANLMRVGDDKCAESAEYAIQLNIQGGQEPYNITWNDPSINGTSLKGLKPGTYAATVTDALKSSTQASINLALIEPIKATASQVKSADLEGKKGAASVQVTGGAGRLKYLWDNGETGQNAERLEAGPHTVTVTDQNGCVTEATVEIAREIPALSASIARIGDDKCAESAEYAIQLNIQGGQEPYNISWNDPSINGTSLKGLKPGTYQATVIDAAKNTVQASINLTEIEVIKAVASQINAAGLDGQKGSALVEVTGSSGRLKYQWDNGETKARAEGLTAGSHSVTVTDQNGCNATASVEITQEIAELVIAIEPISKSKCAGDQGNTIKAVVSGGVGPYTYTWNDEKLHDEMASQLNNGLFQVTVTDSRGQTASSSINLPAIQPLQLETAIHAAATANNSDGRASVRGTGGTGTYTYSWSNGEKSREATNLPPGMHTVTVTDEVGCSSNASVEITENISAMSVVLNLTNELKCSDLSNAAIEALVRGGKSPYTYTWSEPTLQGNKAEGLKGGNFAITVTDAAGNLANASIDIIAPQPLVAEIVEQRGVTDEASKDGKAQVNVSGGSGTYQYLWDNQSTGDKVQNLAIGQHQVTITDGNGCQTTVAFETKQKILPQLSLNKLRSGQVVQMQMLQFDADSTNLNDEAEPILDEVYEFLKDNPGVVIRIEGHTNNIPPDEFCDKLSTARAKAVAEYIVQRGVAGERVYYRGYGKRQPMYSNLTPEGRRQNQRVEIKILNIGEDG